MNNMNLEEAKALMKPAAMENLKHITTEQIEIDMSKKVNMDAIMVALCKAIKTEVIKPSSLSTTLVKMLNSSTNTVSQSKLGEILDQVKQSQPNIQCVVKILSADLTVCKREWVFTSSLNCQFNDMFEYVVSTFGITPQEVREKLSKLLKPSIANNIGQFIVKYQTSNHKDELVVSITTIARLVNMEKHILTVEFIE